MGAENDAASDAQSELERARLAQERELKEKELALTAKGLDIQADQNRSARWSTPIVLAIVAGFLGYLGTLLSSYQTLQLEKQKQEAGLILEAIKTSGTAADKERQTAANLVFFSDAGLITSIRPTEIEKLRAKAKGAGPSLPAPNAPNTSRSVAFETSVPSALQAKLQPALDAFQGYLAGIGYSRDQSRGRVTVRVDENVSDNAYFDGKSVVLGPKLAADPEYTLSEYTWSVLKETNPRAYDASATLDGHSLGFANGLKFYLTCSFLNDPRVGRRYYALSGAPPPDPARSYLYDLDELKILKEDAPQAMEPHHLGEIWGGAFWELRKQFGRDKVDRILLAAWKRLRWDTRNSNDANYGIRTILGAFEEAGLGQNAATVRNAFARRNLK
jgi:hypothetical protein